MSPGRSGPRFSVEQLCQHILAGSYGRNKVFQLLLKVSDVATIIPFQDLSAAIEDLRRSHYHSLAISGLIF